MTDHPPAAIVVKNLIYDYPAHRALHDVSFSVARGSVTALVGPNGAGKTTLMSCLAALARPLSGRIEIDGVDMLGNPREGHRRIGYLKDFFGLYDSLNVRQTLLHAARCQGVSNARSAAVVDEVATALDLTRLLNSAAGELSRGQRQRLAIARTMVHGPPVLLLDEPASGLDPEARHELAMLMRRLQASGVTLLVSSHILAELAEYSTDMMIIRDGRLLEQRSLVSHAHQRLLRMELVEPIRQIPELLASHALVHGARLDDDGMVFGFSGDVGQQHELLAACVAGGIAISALGDAHAGLQDEYLRRVRAEGSAQ
ncbi:MAG: ABC-2 type transport system ATP-binding protein [Gammaproteobacteria bacterium]|jgi:ABC-2 type transport system ATP-binding protein